MSTEKGREGNRRRVQRHLEKRRLENVNVFMWLLGLVMPKLPESVDFVRKTPDERRAIIESVLRRHKMGREADRIHEIWKSTPATVVINNRQ
jgi:hypothetical protein